MKKIFLFSSTVCIVLCSFAACSDISKTSKEATLPHNQILADNQNTSPTSDNNCEIIVPTTAPVADNKADGYENNQTDVSVDNNGECGTNNQTDVRDDNTVPSPEGNQTDLPEEKDNNSNEDKEMQNGYQLFVAGKIVPKGSCMVFYDNPSSVVIPFVDVIEALGARVEKKSNAIFQITLNGEKYILNTEAATLIKEASNINCIIPTPGGAVFYQVVEGEFLLDYITVRTATMIMGLSVKINVDYQNYRVVIEYQ